MKEELGRHLFDNKDICYRCGHSRKYAEYFKKDCPEDNKTNSNIIVVESTTFRSNTNSAFIDAYSLPSDINKTDNMVRVVIDMPLWRWNQVKILLGIP